MRRIGRLRLADTSANLKTVLVNYILEAITTNGKNAGNSVFTIAFLIMKPNHFIEIQLLFSCFVLSH